MSKVDTTIKFYRLQKNLSQNDIAKILGTTQTNISFIETKKQYPDIDTALKISEILGVPIGKLYSEEELNLMKYKSIK